MMNVEFIYGLMVVNINMIYKWIKLDFEMIINIIMKMLLK